MLLIYLLNPTLIIHSRLPPLTKHINKKPALIHLSPSLPIKSSVPTIVTAYFPLSLLTTSLPLRKPIELIYKPIPLAYIP